MKYHSSLLERSRRRFAGGEGWQEWGWGLGLFLAAVLLLAINLDRPSWQPFEKILFRTAEAIANSPHSLLEGLLSPAGRQFPRLESPLLSVSIAFAYRWGGTAAMRWPVAILGMLSVFFLYRAGREVLPKRRMAVLAAGIYLLLSPLIPLGRFSLPAVAGSSLTIATIWLTLRSRRDFRWTIGIGWGLSLLFLTRGELGIAAMGIVCGFLYQDTPRLLQSLYFWAGMILGSLPTMSWIFTHPASVFFSQSDGSALTLSLSYLLKLSCFVLPGWLMGLSGLSLAMDRENWSWAKLTLIWFFGILAVVPFFSFSMVSSLLLFPPLALAGGVKLDELLDSPSDRDPFSLWMRWAIALASIALGCSLGFAWFLPFDLASILVFAAVALCLAMVGQMISRGDRQAPILLFWGMFVTLFLFIATLPA